jgi:hypothetical protein
LVIKVQVTASMLPSPVPVLSSSTQSVLHWVGAKVGLDEDGDTDGPAVGCDEHVALQHVVLQTAATIGVSQALRSAEQDAPPSTPMSGYIGSPVHTQMLLGDSDGADVVGPDVGVLVGVDVLGAAVGVLLI